MKKIIILSIALVLTITGCSLGKGSTGLFKGNNDIGLESAKTKTVDFIDNNLLRPGDKVTVKEATEEDGLYKLVVVMSNGQEVTSYLSKDGLRFYPQAINIAEVEAQNKAQTQTATSTAADATKPVAATDVPKEDKAKVELFVMSYCPYGTQIEKGMLPVIEALGSKMDFSLKFCDYAMHGEKELKEELNQYCIQKNEPKKLVTYLKCFLEASEGDSCLTTAGINKSKLASCVSATDKEFKVTAGFADKTTWANGSYPSFNVFKTDNEKYGVGGSPTLVVNGKQVSSGRDAKSLLATICAGFNKQPAECQKELSGTAPSAGFGTAAATSGAAPSGGGCATN
jgi:hypothetical protein